MPRRPVRKQPKIVRDFGRQVRRLRDEKGWSQQALAERADLHWTYIGGIERGERNVSLINIGRLARAFDLSCSDLLEGIGT